MFTRTLFLVLLALLPLTAADLDSVLTKMDQAAAVFTGMEAKKTLRPTWSTLGRSVFLASG